MSTRASCNALTGRLAFSGSTRTVWSLALAVPVPVWCHWHAAGGHTGDWQPEAATGIASSSGSSRTQEAWSDYCQCHWHVVLCEGMSRGGSDKPELAGSTLFHFECFTASTAGGCY